MTIKEILFRNKGTGVSLIDFSVFAVPKKLRRSRAETMDIITKGWTFNEDALSAMRRGFFGDEAGIGDDTGIPEGVANHQPFDLSTKAAMAEMEMIMYPVVEDALKASGLQPSEHGAAAVISAVARGLGLPPKAAVPSLETLERFGSTMMCSTYYTLANLESQGAVKKGHRILQLGYGSGFKCAAAYWRARRDIKDAKHKAWEP